MATLKIKDVYTNTPGGRDRDSGPGSAQEFYEDILLPAYKMAVDSQEIFTIDMDGTAGYAGSWIDEVFGRLAYEEGQILPYAYLRITSTEEPWLIDKAAQAMNEWVEHGPHENSPLTKTNN